MKNVLITGSSGFIGYHLSLLYLRKGFRVFGIDNHSDGYDVKLKQWRSLELKKNKCFIFHKVDISSEKRLITYFDKFVKKNKLDTIINLAAGTGVRKSTQYPNSYYESNLLGALNLIKLSRKFAVKSFVQASTSSVYGDSKEKSFKINSETSKPDSIYAASKKASEVLLHAYHALYGQNISILRFFTVYGPCGRPDMAPFIFTDAAINNRSINVFGTGKQKRDFTYVDDIVDGIYKSSKLKGLNYLNLGNNKPVSINNLIKIISKFSNKKIKRFDKPSTPEDVFYTSADISKTKRIMNWEPKTDLMQGMLNTYNWHISNNKWLKKIKVS
ncbi:SDR family NAD(P)-dependent oxidoreductase [bacterium]|jgi:nucleoside-diphosphate-sugar epimerase|nr:SDR family NAD(P)-dependent oxidoreductase [bacterium]MBT3795453.1 SDR family NAD(P)-dependent oxidoreductase [bacterium]MBT4633980.1 SDR family NAD(P)-dependent oxidoreductase [bacterium]